MKQINLLVCLFAVWKHRVACVFIIVGITTAVCLYSFTLANVYQAQAAILPLASKTGGSSGNLSGLLDGMAGFGLGRGSASSRILLYLNSKDLVSRVVKNMNLLPTLVPQSSKVPFTDEQKMDIATSVLSGMVKIKNDVVFTEKIHISVESTDPEFASKLVRQYLVELQNFISDNILTQAKRYRFFLEEQLTRSREELLEMGKVISNFYTQYPISVSRGQLKVPVALATDKGPRTFKNYEEFKQYFNVLQKADSNQKDFSYSKEVKFVEDVPHQVFLKQMLVEQETLEGNYAMLQQSYQMAKLDEWKEEPSFQVLDEPTVPKFRSFPNRKRMTTLSFVGACFLALLYSFYREFYVSVRQSKKVTKEKDASFPLQERPIGNVL